MSEREALADHLLTTAIDGDYLIGAGRSIGNEGDNVPINRARAAEVAWWAVDAVLDSPTFADLIAAAERRGRVAQTDNQGDEK